MKQRYTAGNACALMPKLTSDMLVLHPFITLAPKTAGKSAVTLTQCLVLVVGLILALFGILLIAYSFKQRHKLLKRATEGTLFCLFVATIGAVGNAVQNGTANALGSTAASLLVAGAISGIIAGAGGRAAQVIEKLSPSHLILIGSVFIVVGCLIEFIQILAIFVAMS